MNPHTPPSKWTNELLIQSIKETQRQIGDITTDLVLNSQNYSHGFIDSEIRRMAQLKGYLLSLIEEGEIRQVIKTEKQGRSLKILFNLSA